MYSVIRVRDHVGTTYHRLKRTQCIVSVCDDCTVWVSRCEHVALSVIGVTCCVGCCVNRNDFGRFVASRVIGVVRCRSAIHSSRAQPSRASGAGIIGIGDFYLCAIRSIFARLSIERVKPIRYSHTTW